MRNPTILRVPCVATELPFVLLHLSQTGGAELDLEILASEGNTAYSLAVHAAEIHRWKGKAFKAPDGEWQTLLEWALLGRTPSDDRITKGVEAVADVSNSRIEIRLKRSTAGITQQLGCLTLGHNESLENEINVFDWAGIAAAATSEHQRRSHEEQRQLSVALADAEALRRALLELQEEKRRWTRTTLEKFRRELNNKKSKIRDQQRLLAGASVDAKAVQSVTSSRNKPVQSRPTAKRKQGAATPDGGGDASGEVGSGDDSDDDENMDADENGAEDHSDRETPDRSEAESDSEFVVPKEEPQSQAAPLETRAGQSSIMTSRSKAVSAAPEEGEETTDDEEL